MINRVVLVGRLTKDPVLRRTPNGTSVASFTIACDRRNKVEGQPTADFISCTCWNRVAENTATYTHKGSLVGVEGRIQTRSYDDQSGKRVYVTEVVCDSVQFLEPKGSNNQQAGYQSQVQPTYQAQNDYGFQATNNSFNAGFQEQSNAYSADFNSSNGLDIASDDLPF